MTLCVVTGLAAQSPIPRSRQPRAPLAAPDVKAELPSTPKRPMAARSPERSRPSGSAPSREAPVPDRKVLPAPDFLVFDSPGDGAEWVATPNWKARIGADGLVFAPFLGAESDGRLRLSLSLDRIEIAGEPLALGAPAVRRMERGVAVERGSVVERYDARADGLEQSFVFDALPRRGELTLRLAMDVPCPVVSEPDGSLRCVSDRGGVRIADAIAIDADGARCRLAMEHVDGELRLTVPAAFVAVATLPLIVDPTISPIVFVADQFVLERPDLAYDPSLGEYLCVWQRNFSATDRDVYAWRLDAGMQSVGPMQTIDFTLASWESPRIANCDLVDRFLVVAQVSNGSSPYWISARMVSPSGQGPQFVVEQAGLPGHLLGDKLRPDVGGDPSAVGPVYFTVVWERVWSATDHDVHLKQIDGSGALRSPSPTMLENGTSFASYPRISKSDGRNPGGQSASQFWPVVWQQTYAPFDEDVWAIHVTWDGQLATNGAFAVSTSTSDAAGPVASSPTDEVGGLRHTLYAWASQEGQTNWDIIAAYHAANGGQRGAINLSVAEGPPVWAANPQVRPAVDCDGLRFAVGYTEDFVQATLWDTRCALVAWDELTNALEVQESRVWFGQTYGFEDHLSIVAQGAAGGSSILYGVVYDLDDRAGTFSICAHPYSGYADQPLPTTRLTGCGTLGITLHGLPLLGGTITVTQTDSGPLTGFFFGFPTDIPLGPCPGCSLGVDGFTVGNPMSWTVPTIPAYVGVELSVQAYSLVSGPCFGQLSLSNTIDFRLL